MCLTARLVCDATARSKIHTNGLARNVSCVSYRELALFHRLRLGFNKTVTRLARCSSSHLGHFLDGRRAHLVAPTLASRDWILARLDRSPPTLIDGPLPTTGQQTTRYFISAPKSCTDLHHVLQVAGQAASLFEPVGLFILIASSRHAERHCFSCIQRR